MRYCCKYTTHPHHATHHTPPLSLRSPGRVDCVSAALFDSYLTGIAVSCADAGDAPGAAYDAAARVHGQRVNGAQSSSSRVYKFTQSQSNSKSFHNQIQLQQVKIRSSLFPALFLSTPYLPPLLPLTPSSSPFPSLSLLYSLTYFHPSHSILFYPRNATELWRSWLLQRGR